MEIIKRVISPEIRTINEEERSVEFVISDENFTDTYGTVFKASGADLSRYNSNPIVTYMHDDFSNNPDMVIGTSEIRVEDSKIIAKATFEDLDNDGNEVADKVWRKIKKGTLRMASIMASAIDGSFGDAERGEDKETFYFRKWELYSWSVVTHGSNPAALIRTPEEIKFIENKTTKEVPSDYEGRYLKLKHQVK